jgi:hypothetical protein
VALRHVGLGKELWIDLVLQIVDDRDRGNAKLEIGRRRERTKQQVRILLP